MHCLKFKHKPQPLSLYFRAKKTATPSVSSPRFATLPEIRWERNFSIFLSWGCGLPRSNENLLVGSFAFCFTTSFFSESVHPQSIFSCLSRNFPSGCAYCLLIKLILGKKIKIYDLQVNAIIFHVACFLIGRVVSEITSLFHLDDLKILKCSRIKLLL